MRVNPNVNLHVFSRRSGLWPASGATNFEISFLKKKTCLRVPSVRQNTIETNACLHDADTRKKIVERLRANEGMVSSAARSDKTGVAIGASSPTKRALTRHCRGNKVGKLVATLVAPAVAPVVTPAKLEAPLVAPVVGLEKCVSPSMVLVVDTAKQLAPVVAPANSHRRQRLQAVEKILIA